MPTTKSHKSTHNVSLWCCDNPFFLKWRSGKHRGNVILYSSKIIFQVAEKWSSIENSGIIFPRLGGKGTLQTQQPLKAPSLFTTYANISTPYTLNFK